MTQELKDKLTKVYELIKRGTDGEKQAAEKAMNRLVEKYNLHDIDFDKIDKQEYGFKYSNRLEIALMAAIVETFGTPDMLTGCYRTTGRLKEVRMTLTYLDYVTISCAYEYFKRHMKVQWTTVCLPIIKRARKATNRAKKRAEIEELFFQQYIIASKLIDQKHIVEVSADELSLKELKNRKSIHGITGGEYHKQMHTGNLLEAPKP